jgi:hypothetical protein
MLSFFRKENKVIVKLEHGIWGSDEHFALEIGQSFEYQAQLLKDALNKNLQNNLERIRREAYNQGWKDAKAKTRKQTWFSWSWK